MLILQLDELWSFVSFKSYKQQIWLAINYDYREIVGCHICDRSSDAARAFWSSCPGIYLQCATLFNDHGEVYNKGEPQKRYFPIGKDTRLTSYLERFNHTLRQRISRLVRRTFSFSKEQSKQEGAIWNYIHQYNTKFQNVET